MASLERLERLEVKMLPMRQHLPAFHMAKEICSSVRDNQVTLILGATGCGSLVLFGSLSLIFLIEHCSRSSNGSHFPAESCILRPTSAVFCILC